MKLTQYYPVICTQDVAATRAFYEQHFNFAPAFESDWYVHLTSKVDPNTHLAVLDCRHETIPEGYRKPAQGVLINFEVEDVDAEYSRAKDAGLNIRLDLRDEAFGQRHFIVADPNGILIDVIKPIPPSAEFAAQFREGVLERDLN
ncbi:VOC family protein [uncultured Ferrovibrio sp.]|jgi:catechol 2,3-dioxygenase-like lactoylglutathione lyase family enzyme|uniref:VOC family protein n=1 Tax=uncultured Ferrovibrio sp. TaxID=1576913 RepID=UPI00261F2074|nr:VOC family protein [uncultured Ferrovibrio sp.]